MQNSTATNYEFVTSPMYWQHHFE